MATLNVKPSLRSTMVNPICSNTLPLLILVQTNTPRIF